MSTYLDKLKPIASAIIEAEKMRLRGLSDSEASGYTDDVIYGIYPDARPNIEVYNAVLCDATGMALRMVLGEREK